MDSDKKLAVLENQLKDLKQRWPAHSVKPQMIEEMERIEDEIGKLMSLIVKIQVFGSRLLDSCSGGG